MSEAASPAIGGRAHTDTWARVATERALVTGALVVVALHVADDNLLQPQPGTSAGDHLVSGLVPLALLALAAWTYPRLRSGFRAAIVVIVGTFGIVAGVEAVYYTTNGGPSGDDFTGFASIAAGLLLLGVGAVTLWRTRRTDDRLRRRYLRRLLLAVAGFVAAYVLLFPLYYSYVLTHVARGFVAEPALGAVYEKVSFPTSDGLELKGWYIPSKNGAAVIAFPGRRGPQRQARMLARHGYGVLLFDRRGEGESEGDPNALGWAGARDLHAAVEFLESRPDVDRSRIGGIGLSVGGEMMIEAAAQSDRLKAVVSEGAGIRSIREALAIPGTRKRLESSLVHAVATPAVALFSNKLAPQSLEDLAGRISPRPLFLIYATPGQGGEAELTQLFYDAAREPKAIWRVPGSGHTGGIEARPREYERRVIRFFDDALRQPPAGRSNP